MPNDSSTTLDVTQSKYTYTDINLYPKDEFGYRSVPVVIKDIYGRKSRTEWKKMNQYEYDKWRKGAQV